MKGKIVAIIRERVGEQDFMNYFSRAMKVIADLKYSILCKACFCFKYQDHAYMS